MSFWFSHLDFTSSPSGLINQLSSQIQTGRISDSTIFNIAHRITSVPLDDDIKGRILTKFETNLFVYNKLIKV